MTQANTQSVDVTRLPVIQGLSVRSVRLIELLRVGKPGDVLTDAQLTAAAGVSCAPGGEGYGFLGTAIRHCLRNHELKWERVRGGGFIKCLGAVEKLACVGKFIERADRVVRRNVTLLKTIDAGELPDAAKTEYLTRRAQLGAIATFSGKDAAKRIEAAGVTSMEEIARRQQRMLDAMVNGAG